MRFSSSKAKQTTSKLLSTLLGLSAMLSSHKILAEAAPIDIPQINSATITVDGKLDEAVWQKATKVDINNITYPQDNGPAPVKTTGYLFEDGETLYVGFKAEDPNPENIRAFLRDRDSNNIWNDDLIGIKLDTYGDSKLAYQFWVSALGVQVDSIENVVTQRESNAWDAIWDSAGRITQDGYIVEMALPLRILNFNDQLDIQNWRVELVRFYPRGVRQRLSNMTVDPSNTCKVCQMGLLRGFKGVKQGKNIAVVPSLTVGGNQSRELSSEGHSDWESDSNFDVGLDVKWGITPDISFNATINPDFSQIEADAGQLSINNTFALFFQEKRTFFLDNIDYFSTPFNLVYTRNISEPDYGAKLTGRLGEHSFGLFAANDVGTTLFIPGNIGSSVTVMEEESQNAVLRYRYDPSKDLSIGWIGTFRQNDADYHNYVSGFDLKYKITEQDDITAQWLYSDTQYSSELYKDFYDEDENAECEILNCEYNEQVLRTQKAGSFGDNAMMFRYNHRERDWDVYASYRALGKDYRADLGFTNIVDWQKYVFGGNRIWRANTDDWWRRIRVGGDWDITHNDNGELLEKESQVWVRIDALNLSTINSTLTERYRVGDRTIAQSLAVDGNAPMFKEIVLENYLDTQINNQLKIGSNINFGDEVDFANNRLGEMVMLRPQITYNPNKHITFKSQYTYKKLDADGAEVFTAKLLDARLTYQFSTRSFIRLAVIYSDISRNQDNYFSDVDSRSKNLSTQLLYSYKLNPQSLFFVGYSDSAYANDEINDLSKDNRTIFMKFSYAWLQ